MSDTWIGKKGGRYLYYRFRDSEYFSLSLVGLTVLTCLVLIFMVIIPQLTSWFSIRDETIAARSRIAVLQSNINFLTNLDRNKVENQLTTVTTALPTEKDFGSILDVLSDAAVTSGVALNDYTFQIGNIKSSAKETKNQKDPTTARVTVIVTGSIENIKQYITNIQASVPLAEVVNIDGGGQTMSLSIQFYQKPFPKIVVNDDTPLQALPADKLDVIAQLASMRKVAPVDRISPDAFASGSAMPLF